jgi:hypothetical protein
VEPFRHDYAISTDNAGADLDEVVMELQPGMAAPTAAYTGPQVADT